MEIKEIKKENEIEEYRKLASSYGSIFNTYEWLKIFNNIVLYGIYDKGGNLIGGFHLYEEKRIGLTIYRNPPFTPFVGPFFKIDAHNPVNVLNKYREILSVVAEFLEQLDYSIISISLGRNIMDTLPFIWKRFKVVPGYTYILDLKKSVDDLYNRMSVERRNDINKAIKDNLAVRKIDDYNIVKSLVLKTFSRQKKDVDNKYYLDKILFSFANDNNSFAFATFKEEIPIASAFCVYDRTTAYYLLGGYDHEFKHHGAGALAVWEAIKCSKELGLKYFDFEGSMIPQIERYFRGFGGELTAYFRINRAWLPLEVILKCYRRELF
ncbi:hypothetical protein JOD02_000563 [Caldicoprobacter guelmensis]|uniref:GNAT family N-acetyltransferase n=1 Tax=Caldicoprobacter guelmensis TaxID=1170224 RepID=UPI00195E207B|nr:hypothetical protein [Caldicoprobacter guelmensis]